MPYRALTTNIYGELCFNGFPDSSFPGSMFQRELDGIKKIT
jgi:hypothetical protein